MNKYNHLRKKARELRRKDFSLGEIVDRLSLPKTTIYYWIKDIPLSPTKRGDNLSKALKAARKACKKKYRLLREEAYQEGLNLAPELFKDSNFRDFMVAYLCEGYKRDRNRVSMGNSDGTIVKLAYGYFNKFSNRTLRFYLQCHEDNDEDELKCYWANLLDIDPNIIKIIRKSNSGNLSGRQWRCKFGVLQVDTSDTYFRSKIEAWIDYLKNEWKSGE